MRALARTQTNMHSTISVDIFIQQQQCAKIMTYHAVCLEPVLHDCAVLHFEWVEHLGVGADAVRRVRVLLWRHADRRGSRK